MVGILVVVATPIGNLGDLSPRAVDELRLAEAVACEDTRRTGKLLAHAAIEGTRYIVMNEHTEQRAIESILDRLDAGERVAVVSDAGMPGVSDPGERVVAAAVAKGHIVTVVPGPSAALTALVSSGLPTGRFVFEGFLPRKGSGRSERLVALMAETRTMILYEAPHRLERTLTDLANVLGPDRAISCARELTKLHEEIWRGPLSEAVAWAATKPKGEFVLVVAGAPAPEPPTDDELLGELREALAGGATKRDAAGDVADRLGVGRRRAYELANRLD